MFAIIPVAKNVIINLYVPIVFSSTNPKKKSANRLNARWVIEPCRKIEVRYLQTSKLVIAFWFKINKSVNPGIPGRFCNMKINIIITDSHSE